MSLRAVLDVLLVEVQGYLAEPSLLAVCPLTHRRAAFDAHLRWFVPRVKARRDFLRCELYTSWSLLANMYDRAHDYWLHPHPEGVISEYSSTSHKVLNRLHKALWPGAHTDSETESDG